MGSDLVTVEEPEGTFTEVSVEVLVSVYSSI